MNHHVGDFIIQIAFRNKKKTLQAQN